ncbi:hypothetical protein MTR_6g488160 [Medicago truncatula]|uniref:Uncharacterized protein n=1 Tax=Medicago truncatula TaxID=3880 RepID=G8A0N5_MEDTR|nr:hypothetical protein MTR_6g488160 [Medicago truncatula]
MGNSLCGDEYCVTLGNHANIDMIKEDDESEDDEGYSQGPDQHPSSALFYMFEQVYRSGNWKFASCPHCAGESQGQSSETMPKNNINNNTLPENMDWLRSTISTHTHN